MLEHLKHCNFSLMALLTGSVGELCSVQSTFGRMDFLHVDKVYRCSNLEDAKSLDWTKGPVL